jgi:hypothetical protein
MRTGAGFSRSSTDTAQFREKPFGGWTAKALLVAGMSVMAFGVLGLFHNASRTHPDQWIRWFLGALLAHDLIVAPVVFSIAALVVSRIPARFRGPIQGGLLASGTLALVSFPFVRGYGRTPENPTVLPNNYAWGVAATLAMVWIVVAVVVAWRRFRFFAILSCIRRKSRKSGGG